MMLNEISYELILDDQGIAKIDTQKIIGELRAVLFKVPDNNFSSFLVNIDLKEYDYQLFKEEVSSDTYYPLKVLSRDGFNQYLTQSEYYFLNDSLAITIQGIPLSSIICTLRWN